jgi:transcriptional regulator with XRE-family HTH domain
MKSQAQAFTDAKTLIQAELSRRIQKNPNYSLRAFARASGISHTVLSLVLSGKRPLSKKASEQLADFLGLDPLKRELLLKTRKASSRSKPDESHWLTMDSFAAIAEWQHYAILSALELPDAEFDPKWIAKRLGITRMQAKITMERLERLGLVQKNADGQWRQSGKPIRMENQLSTAAARSFHTQLLNKAAQSLELTPFESRDVSSITFAMDPKLLSYAQQRIRQFRRELCEELEKLSAPSEVYHLSVQLFPLTQVNSRSKSQSTPSKKEKSL